ncbi:MAG: hypothetical protein JO159_00300 [Acidobacteria bacterium]|nr:hypothetical protein [Acidobacteriota bacterium]
MSPKRLKWLGAATALPQSMQEAAAHLSQTKQRFNGERLSVRPLQTGGPQKASIILDVKPIAAREIRRGMRA